MEVPAFLAMTRTKARQCAVNTVTRLDRNVLKDAEPNQHLGLVNKVIRSVVACVCVAASAQGRLRQEDNEGSLDA